MKIAFIGDSFCGGNTEHSWTNIVSKRLDADVICRGKGGMSIGQALFDLAEVISDTDIYFMFYTECSRLYNAQQYPLNVASCADFTEHGLKGMKSHDGMILNDEELWEAGARYYRCLHDDAYAMLIHELLIDRCDKMISEELANHSNKRAFHFHSFPVRGQSKKFSSGPCCRESMFDYITRHGTVLRAGDINDNHMSIGLNAHFAKEILRMLESNIHDWFDIA